MLSALVGTLGQFIVARVALGMGESPMFVGGARVCAERFAPEARAVPLGLLNASAALGPALAPLVLTPLMAAAGWRAAFAVVGGAGLVLAAAWGLIYRDTPRREAPPSIAGPRQWVALLRQRSIWGLLSGFGGTVYVTWLYVTWLPSYLHQSWHMTPHYAGLWSAMPQFCGFFGAIAGGWLSDILARHMPARQARQAPLVVGLLGAAAFSALACRAGNVTLAIAAVSAAVFAANLATTSGWALAAVLAPTDLIATVEAMANIGGSIGGSLAPLVTGYAVQATGSFTAALMVASAIAAITACANLVLTKDDIRGGG
jgi:nitrate/nitrite transporter NarK